jgi:ferredoxin
MTADFADEASEYTERQLSDALKVRKPVSEKCEDCGKPAHVLHNGARCRWCKACMAINAVGVLDTL